MLNLYVHFYITLVSSYMFIYTNCDLSFLHRRSLVFTTHSHIHFKMMFMEIPTGTFLYRGQVTNEKRCPPNSWYTDRSVTAATYGDVNKILVKSPISVLNMSNTENIRRLSKAYLVYADEKNTHPRIFDRMYILQEDGSVHRYSQFVADTVIVDFFQDCQRKGIVDPSLHGFGAAAMLPGHHWEVFLSRPEDLMEIVTCVPISPTQRKYLCMTRKDALNRKSAKRKRRRMRPSALQFGGESD